MTHHPPRAHPPPLWCRWHSRIGRWQVEVRLRGRSWYVGQWAEVDEAIAHRNQWLYDVFGPGGLAVAWKLRRRRRAPQARVDAARHELQDTPDVLELPALAPVLAPVDTEEELMRVLDRLERAREKGW